MKKCGFITVLGETNAGKSTLVNRLVGQKVSIVSRKRQTTIGRITGIAVHGDSQMIFIDTPGFLRGEKHKNPEKIAWDAFRESDLVMFVVDANKKNMDNSLALLQKISSKQVVLVLNKIDLVHKPKLLQLVDKFGNDFLRVFMVSSLKRDGIDELKRYLAELMPESEWIYNNDEATNMPFEEYVSEITREHVYDQLHQEIPYECTIKTVNYRKKSNHMEIHQEICVKTESQKSIVIGNEGKKIKSIGIASRRELSRLLGCRVDLFLRVTVDDDR